MDDPQRLLARARPGPGQVKRVKVKSLSEGSWVSQVRLAGLR
jgi:hypothetical protein